MQLRNTILLFLFLALTNVSYAEKLSIQGSLRNGTVGGSGKADAIRLFALQGAMLPLADLGPQSGVFRFPQIDLPEGAPLLLQVEYQGANYNKMIPPTKQFRTATQEIVVYNSNDSKVGIITKSLMQVMREKRGIRIFKLFLIENSKQPPQSFLSKENPISFSISSEAKEIVAQLKQPGSQMAIPLSLGNSETKRLERAILPGVSELQISYLLPEGVLEETLYAEAESGKLPIFLKPKDMQIITEAKLLPLEKDVPDGLSAYILETVKEGQKILLRFEGGKAMPSFTQNTQREIWNGSLLTSWDLSFFAIVGFLGLFFTLSFVFVYRKETGKSK